VLILAALPLLLPHAPRHLREFRAAFAPRTWRVRAAGTGAALVLSAIVPVAGFAAARTTGDAAEAASLTAGTMPVPVNAADTPSVTAAGRRITLRWRSLRSVGGPVFYRVSRIPAASGDGLSCSSGPGGRSCLVSLLEVGVTHGTTFVDKAPKGRWVYRVAVAANWLDDPAYGDVYLVGKPITVTVR
jgi:hypothetical protein